MSNIQSEKSPLIQLERGSASTNSYEVAREAYQNADAAYSRQIHANRTADDLEEECHQEGGGFVKTVVFGGLDGILTIFAIVAGMNKVIVHCFQSIKSHCDHYRCLWWWPFLGSYFDSWNFECLCGCYCNGCWRISELQGSPRLRLD